MCVSSQLGTIEAFVSLRSGACQPETHVGHVMVTETDGSPTSKILDKASRIDWTRSCVAAVLSVWAENCNGCTLGTRRVSSVRYSTCIFETKSWWNRCYAWELDWAGDLSSCKCTSLFVGLALCNGAGVGGARRGRTGNIRGGVGGVSRGVGGYGPVSVIGSPEGVAAIRGRRPMLARC